MARLIFLKYAFITCILSSVIVQTAGEIHRIRKSNARQLKSRQPQKVGIDIDGGEGLSFIDINDSSFTSSSTEDGEIIRNNYIFAILATILVGLTGIVPLVLPLDPKSVDKDGSRRLNLFLSFAVGGLLGDVFLHLLPEAFSHYKAEDRLARVQHGVFLITGLFVFMILEAVFSDESDQDDKEEKTFTASSSPVSNGHTQNGHSPSRQRKIVKTRHSNGTKNGIYRDTNSNKIKPNGNHQHETHGAAKKQVTGYLNLLANFIDNFTHGLAVGGSFMVSTKVGWHTTLAILLHEIPHEIGDFAILLRAGFGRWEAAKSQMLTSLGGLVGCSVALLAESAEIAGTNSAWILPFTSGGFLNIALVTIVPDLMKETNAKESTKQVLCLALGVAVMALVNIVSPH